MQRKADKVVQRTNAAKASAAKRAAATNGEVRICFDCYFGLRRCLAAEDNAYVNTSGHTANSSR